MFHSPDITSKILKYFLPLGKLNLGFHTMSTMEYENENGRYDGTSNVCRVKPQNILLVSHPRGVLIILTTRR